MSPIEPAAAGVPAVRESPKRRAILAGAFEVFAASGYGATIEAIVDSAGVSSRTLYKHFRDKDELYVTVVADSAQRVADAQIALMGTHLTDVTDVYEALVAFGLDWVEPLPGAEAHFALVQQLVADPGRIPAIAFDAWADAGPNRVQRVLGAHLDALAKRGLLAIDEPVQAALHFGRLVNAGGPTWVDTAHHRTPSRRPDEVEADVRAAVRTFLYGFTPRDHA